MSDNPDQLMLASVPSTPPIAPEGHQSAGEWWGQFFYWLAHPFQSIAGVAGAAGAAAGGASPKEAAQAGQQAAQAPLQAPIEAAKHATGLEASPWLTSQPGTIGVWVLLALLLLLAVWGLLGSGK